MTRTDNVSPADKDRSRARERPAIHRVRSRARDREVSRRLLKVNGRHARSIAHGERKRGEARHLRAIYRDLRGGSVAFKRAANNTSPSRIANIILTVPRDRLCNASSALSAREIAAKWSVSEWRMDRSAVSRAWKRRNVENQLKFQSLNNVTYGEFND